MTVNYQELLLSLEITPSAAAKLLPAPRLPNRSKAAKNDVAIFITFISFLFLSSDRLGKADAKPCRERKAP